MAIYASGKTVPQLDSISAVADNGLVIVHNDAGLKKMTVSDFRSAMAGDVNNKLEAEIERAQQAEQANATAIEEIKSHTATVDWANITNKPTKLSAFENDSNYVTQTYVDNLFADIKDADTASY